MRFFMQIMSHETRKIINVIGLLDFFRVSETVFLYLNTELLMNRKQWMLSGAKGFLIHRLIHLEKIILPMQKLIIGVLLMCFSACMEPAKEVVDKKSMVVIGDYNDKKEQEAILEVIDAETTCFFERDYECWKQYFVHADYAFQAWNNTDGSIDTKSGWKEVDEKIRGYIMPAGEKKAKPKSMGQESSVKAKVSSHPKVVRKNMLFKFFTAELVYMMWDQYNSDPDKMRFTFSKECRIMEKINGEWKIANVTSYWDFRREIPLDSL